MTTECLHPVSRNHQLASRHGLPNPLLSTFKKLLNIVQRYFVRRREQKIGRDALAQLNDLDDSTLRDIGLTQGDVEWANQLPLSVNAAKELRKIADERRQRLYW